VAAWLKEKSLDAVVIAALDLVAWLFNLRGSDVDRTPVALAFALVHADGSADLFMAPEKVTPDLVAHLGEGVRLAPEMPSCPRLKRWAGARLRSIPIAAWRQFSARSKVPGRRLRRCSIPRSCPRR
jgi:Xaa-Pro aminopeptidase